MRSQPAFVRSSHRSTEPSEGGPRLKPTQTEIPGVLVFEPRVITDSRGCFFESYRQDLFAHAVAEGGDGLPRTFVQDNQSRSVRSVLRGLHYQVRRPQGKLLRVVSGEIFDVAVDIRRSSATFGKWVGTVLSAENRRQLWIPEGFAHGFLVLSDGAEVVYKATNYYSPANERTLLWNDPDIGIAWPTVAPPVLAERDLFGTPLKQAELFD